MPILCLSTNLSHKYINHILMIFSSIYSFFDLLKHSFSFGSGFFLQKKGCLRFDKLLLFEGKNDNNKKITEGFDLIFSLKSSQEYNFASM